MGLEYRHFLAPRSPSYELDPAAIDRLDVAFRELGVVASPPALIDWTPLRGGKIRRKDPKPKPMPRLDRLPAEFDVVWPWPPDESAASRALAKRVARVFGAEQSYHQRLFLEPRLIAGPTWKVLSDYGDQPISIEVTRGEVAEGDYSLRTSVGRHFRTMPETTISGTLTANDGGPMPIPSYWMPGAFRVCLLLDFGGSLPDFWSEGDCGLPEPLLRMFESALGATLGQAHQAWF